MQAKKYLEDNPDVAAKLEEEIRTKMNEADSDTEELITNTTLTTSETDHSVHGEFGIDKAESVEEGEPAAADQPKAGENVEEEEAEEDVGVYDDLQFDDDDEDDQTATKGKAKGQKKK